MSTTQFRLLVVGVEQQVQEAMQAATAMDDLSQGEEAEIVRLILLPRTEQGTQ